jgi:hypothetical protein
MGTSEAGPSSLLIQARPGGRNFSYDLLILGFLPESLLKFLAPLPYILCLYSLSMLQLVVQIV